MVDRAQDPHQALGRKQDAEGPMSGGVQEEAVWAAVVATAGAPKNGGGGSLGVALLDGVEEEGEEAEGVENIGGVVVGAVNVAAVVDVDGADVAVAGVDVVDVEAAVAVVVVDVVVVDDDAVDAAGAGADTAVVAGVDDVAGVDASLLLAVDASVESGEDVSSGHSREECEYPFVVVSAMLGVGCVPSPHDSGGVEEEREEESQPEEGQAQGGDVPLAKTGSGRTRVRRRRSVKTNEFNDERPTTEGRDGDDNN
ncbi:hypothetical protein HOY82DRAFT_608551 [Tuber indicum]|nr:hypothetical protein HOY82DRAFT_608551 [Tuber indicum]